MWKYMLENLFYGQTLKRLALSRIKSLDKTSSSEKLRNLRNRSIIFLKGPKSWLIILPLLFIVFLLAITDLKITPIFFFEKNEIYKFLGNWLGYFIGLFGAVIAVAIFVISGIQQRNQTEENLSIIFRESLLFPLLYYSLALIGILLFISFKPIFLTENQIIRITVLGLYLFIIELILIAYLFTKAFKFINPSFLIKKYYDELRNTLTKELKEDFLTKMSGVIFREELGKINFETNYLYYKPQDYHEIRIDSKQKYVIKDFYINKLKKMINDVSKEPEISYIYPISLNQTLHEKSTILWVKNKNLLKLFDDKKLIKLFDLAEIETGQSATELIKQRMRNRLFDSIRKGNNETFFTIIELYEFIFNLFAKMYNDYNIYDSGVELNSVRIFSPIYSWQILYGFDSDFRDAHELAVSFDLTEIKSEITKLIFRIFVLGLTKKNLTIIYLTKKLLIHFLVISNKKSDMEFLKDSYLYMRLKEIIALQAPIEYEKSIGNEKEKVFAIMLMLFNEYANIIKYLISIENHPAFTVAWNEFRQIQSLFEATFEKSFTPFPYSVEQLPTNYFIGNYFALWSWLINLFRHNKIETKFFTDVEKEFEIQKIDLSIIFDYYLLESDKKYFWEEWDVEEPKPMQAYWVQSTEDWLLFAIIIFLIKYKQTYAFTYEHYSQRPDWYFQTINSMINIVLNQFDSKWYLYFKDQDLNQIKESTNAIIEKLEEYKNTFEYQKTEEIIKTNISEEVVKKFVEENRKHWKKTKPIYELFLRYNIVNSVPENIELPKCGHTYNLINGKKWFIYDEDNYIHLRTEFGFNHNKNEKINFINKIVKNRNDKERKFTELENCFETLIAELRQNEIEPNLIICSRIKLLHDRELRSSSKFKNGPLIGYVNDPKNIDVYDDIPIYYIEDKNMPFVIVSKFEESFSMRTNKSKENSESIFQMKVHAFTGEEADQLIAEKNATWIKDDFGKLISDDQTKEKILSSVRIEVYSEIDFVIENNDLYKIGKIVEEQSTH